MTLTADQIVYTFADGVALVCALALATVLFGRHRLRQESYVLRYAIVVAALLGLRILDLFWDATVVNVTIELVVAVLPVLALLMAESLIRRHAPVWIKLTCITGSLSIALLAVFRLDQLDEMRIPAMGAILVSCLSLVLGFIILRDRKSLMSNENDRVSSLLLGFAILIPFAATDFLDDRYERLVEMGALGILCLTLSMVRGVSGRPGILGYLVDLVAAAGISIVLVSLTSLLIEISSTQRLELWVCFAAFAIAVMLFGHLARMVRDRAMLPLSSFLAHARTEHIQMFLHDLQDHYLLRSSRLIEGDELKKDVPPEVLELLETSPVVSRPVLEDLRATGNIAPDREAALSLLMANQMTHVVSFGTSPPRILLCETAMLGADRAEVDDLLLLSRMARQIEGINGRG